MKNKVSCIWYGFIPHIVYIVLFKLWSFYSSWYWRNCYGKISFNDNIHFEPTVCIYWAQTIRPEIPTLDIAYIILNIPSLPNFDFESLYSLHCMDLPVVDPRQNRTGVLSSHGISSSSCSSLNLEPAPYKVGYVMSLWHSLILDCENRGISCLWGSYAGPVCLQAIMMMITKKLGNTVFPGWANWLCCFIFFSLTANSPLERQSACNLPSCFLRSFSLMMDSLLKNCHLFREDCISKVWRNINIS